MKRLLVNSVFVERRDDGNVGIGMIHGLDADGVPLVGRGLLRHDGAVVVERADVPDLIKALEYVILHGWVE